MLWFEPLPWGRWVLVLLVAAIAAYIELGPDPTVDHPFATVAIAPGDVIDSSNTESRSVPADLLEDTELGSIAKRPIMVGDPVLASDVGDVETTVPAGWWVVGVTLPDGAQAGDRVRLVLLDTGTEVEGVVAHPGSDDPFDAADGGVAVPAESSAEVALAAADARLAVLIATG
ncbi:MAG TPA: SAF domain-containing protein [Acidimicrobiia bacterium]